ncbi:hypothetical protein HLPCO_002505 [Haloplasma contractile SSD-17B]|uniref:Uncharacterized protein n=1 Tax=Haloplasma contractile SSD-17B TaxID=1033810 RepID=U2E865_9MOLU|nr:hypothetical protein HLPCO_002505 [Haloplasma contractile SSD-17B]
MFFMCSLYRVHFIRHPFLFLVQCSHKLTDSPYLFICYNLFISLFKLFNKLYCNRLVSQLFIEYLYKSVLNIASNINLKLKIYFFHYLYVRISLLSTICYKRLWRTFSNKWYISFEYESISIIRINFPCYFISCFI